MEIVKFASHLRVFYNNGSVLHMSTLASKGWHGIQAIKAVNNNTIKCKMKLKENGFRWSIHTYTYVHAVNYNGRSAVN